MLRGTSVLMCAIPKRFTLLRVLSLIWLCRNTGSLIVEGTIHFLVMMVLLDILVSSFTTSVMLIGTTVGV